MRGAVIVKNVGRPAFCLRNVVVVWCFFVSFAFGLWSRARLIIYRRADCSELKCFADTMMSPIISDLDKLTAHLAARGQRRRVAVVCGTDVDTLRAVADATAGGYAHAIFVGRVAETRRAAEGLMDLSQADFVDAADDTDAARAAC